MTAGDALFPPAPTRGSRVRNAFTRDAEPSVNKTATKVDRCFSLVFADGPERYALHLEIPGFGNGRSRNEWASSWASLMYGNFDERLDAEDAGQGLEEGQTSGSFA